MNRLRDKVVVITGGARGQGAAECRLFSDEGATVITTDVLDEEGESVARACGATFLHHDVADGSAWDLVVETTLRRWGRIDGLVNNAAIHRREGLLATDEQLYRLVTDINQMGVYLGMRAVAPSMERAGGGSIINVSSVAGFIGTPTGFAYTASKWAVRGMTRSAALELAPAGIRVNSVHPGPIDTPMITPLAPGSAPPRVPLGRRGTPEEVALLMLYLVSDESSYCTGSEFVVDGGMIAG